MLTEDIIGFLKKVAPFSYLDEATLRDVSGKVSMELHPRGSYILRQDGPPSEYLRIIKKGTVKVFMTTGEHEEVIIDYRGEGESFGLLSLIGGDKSRANVVAVEDTICYLVGKETVTKLLDTHAAFTEFYLKSFFNKFIDKTYQEMQDKSVLFSGGDKVLFTTPLGDLVTKAAITIAQDAPVREVAETMSQNKISSIVVIDPKDRTPLGIITDRDLRDKIIARGRSTTEPASSIMSISLIKADAQDYCFEALLKMIRYNIHHLLVVDRGQLRGVVTNHDLMMLQGISPLSISREIDAQETVEGLIPVANKFNKIIDLLVKEGARAGNIIRVITEINDRLMKKILEIVETRLGPPPVNYCWIVFGSEGRKEQTFRTDQDNAIIYDDPKSDAEADSARQYFSNFAQYMRESLIKAGFPSCPGNYMASNPKWCQPFSVWKEYFSRWINHATPEAVLNSLILFDFRPINGNITLAQKLRSYLTHLLKNQNIFFAQMAAAILKNRPPIGFFGTLVTEKRGDHKNEINIKENGIGIIVGIVRLLALEKGVMSTSTAERIRELRDKHPVMKELGEEIEQALEFLMLLRIHHQYEQIRAGSTPDNFISPDDLSVLERNTMKETFKLLSKIYDSILENYRAGMVGQA